MTSIIPRISGIYKITCIANGKFYIGSSVSISYRWKNHISRLSNRKHDNRHLQRAWEKYGEKSFVFEILELCNVELLIQREQHYLDTLQPFNGRGFNIGRDAEAVMRGRTHSPESRAKTSAATKAYMTSLENREKIVQKLGLDYLITSPDGVEYRIKGLAKFCREHGLHNSNMCAVAKGKLPHHKGWKCQKVQEVTL